MLHEAITRWGDEVRARLAAEIVKAATDRLGMDAPLVRDPESPPGLMDFAVSPRAAEHEYGLAGTVIPQPWAHACLRAAWTSALKAPAALADPTDTRGV